SGRGPAQLLLRLACWEVFAADFQTQLGFKPVALSGRVIVGRVVPESLVDAAGVRAGDEAVAIFGAKVNEMSSYELERMLTQRPLRMQFAQQPGGRPADDDGQHAAEPTRAAARGHR
ncbi:unnamed protein product, partial [Prorocentrum cordatum]